MKNFGKMMEFLSKLSEADWSKIVSTLTPVAVRLLTDWLLAWSRQYNQARLESSRTPKKKLLNLGPSPDYVEAMLDELLNRQKIWLHQGKPSIEVLFRTIGWGLRFFKGVLWMTLDNIRSTRKEIKRNREG